MLESTGFLGLPQAELSAAQIALLPIPYEGAVSYGAGAAEGPAAIWDASTQVELWDYELGVDLESIAYHSAAPVEPVGGETGAEYLDRVGAAASALHGCGALVIGVGGDHSVTPPLLSAAIGASGVDAAAVTVVHIDAHADLRDEYEGNPNSHACAMARALDQGVRVLSIGIRSAEKKEFDRSQRDDRITTYPASLLATDAAAVERLFAEIAALRGPVYLTFDIDALETHLAPATGTPEPGGLGWWFTLDLLRRLLLDNTGVRCIGADLVEVAPQDGTSVNEFVAAKLIAKFAVLHSLGQQRR
ncbi:MAG: agmatinase [Phycisphaeraceae bacterium]|nr:agmatinase [Phycisphaeraceae bacterium]MCB9847491.1 agmatinase [Phycisphaeraceae bacterium]